MQMVRDSKLYQQKLLKESIDKIKGLIGGLSV